MNGSDKQLQHEQIKDLLALLNSRFHNHMHRHQDLKWQSIEARLLSNPDKLWSLHNMENSGGEPDVINYNTSDDYYLFADCSEETPSGRRNLCYDREALDSRKTYKPGNSALDMAKFMGIELMTEAQYYDLQNLGEFDTKTSSWLETPFAIRKPGGAIFGDRRYGRVFIYHNGASSYYSVRGFRGTLKI
jgi:hypothetical protein